MKNICPKCDNPLEDGARFCHICGTANAVESDSNSEASNVKVNSCPTCSTMYTADFRFCQIDGERLLVAEEMLPRCVVCYKRYTNDITVCPLDGGEVKYIPRRSKRPKHHELDNSRMFEKIFSFKGRIRRTEYGVTLLIYLLFHFMTLYILESTRDQSAAIIVLLLLVPTLWILWAQAAKRCHDLGNSGWYQLIPFYGLLLLFQDGQKGTNEYGRDSKN